MRGLIAHLVKLFCGWVVVVGAVVGGLHVATGRPLWGGLGAGLLAGSLGWMAVACLSVVVRSLRERAAIRRGMGAAPPKEGPSVVIGRIDTSRPLLAPFDGRECVAYTYEIWREKRVGRSMSRLVLYRGVGLAPSQIVGPSGTVRLLAVPTLEGAEPYAPSEGAVRHHVERYLAETAFTPRTSSSGTKELEAQWSDTDGEYRSDISAVTGRAEGSEGSEPEPHPAGVAPDLAGCHFEQRIVPRGAQVCVFGHYSAALGGIVALSDWSRTTRLLVGDPAEASRKLAARARLQLVLATVFALATAGVLAAFLSHARAGSAGAGSGTGFGT